MLTDIVTRFADTLGSHMPRELIVFIISLFPILELRGGILAASILDVELWKGVLISAAGNFIPIPFILLLIRKIFAALKKIRLFRPIVEKLEGSAYSKKHKIERYELIGLMLFVGIPLPGTGAWTGSLIAALIEMNVKKAIKAEVAGICIAAVIMTAISYGIVGNIIR